MNQYYFSYDLRSANEYFIEQEIIPLLESKKYLNNEIILCYPQNQHINHLVEKLQDRFEILSPSFLMTWTQLKQEIYNQILIESTFQDHILMTDIAKQLLMNQAIKSYVSENDSKSYFKNLLEYPLLQNDLIQFLSKLKQQRFLFLQPLSKYHLFTEYTKVFKKLLDPNKQLPLKYTEIFEILYIYETIKSKSKLLDRDDMDWYTIQFFKQSSKPLKYFKYTNKIYLFNLRNLSQIDYEIIRLLISMELQFTVTFFHDPNRKEIFYFGEEIKQFFTQQEFNPIKDIHGDRNTTSSERLTYLHENLFTHYKPIDNQLLFEKDFIHIIPSNNRSEEITNIAKMIKELLINDPNLTLNDITIVTRNINQYSDIITSTFKKYQIPVSITITRKLYHEKLIQNILLMLELVVYNYPTDKLIQFINSNYIFLRKKYLDIPENSVSEIINIINNYYQRIKYTRLDIQNYLESILDNEFVDTTKKQTISQAVNYIKLIKKILSSYLNLIERDLLVVITGTKELINDIFSVLYRIYNHDNLELVKRDTFILNTFYEILDEFLYYNNFTNTKKSSSYDIHQSLIQILKSKSYSMGEYLKNTLHCQNTDNIENKTYKIIFIIGMTEGYFPIHYTPDILFKDNEKRIINSPTNLLNTSEIFIHNEETQFLNVLGSVTNSLYISYSKIDDRKRESLPSFFLDDVSLCLSIDLSSIETELQNSPLYSVDEIYQYYAKTCLLNEEFPKDVLNILSQQIKIDNNFLEIISGNIKMEQLRSSKSLSIYEGNLSTHNNQDSINILSHIKHQTQEISSSQLEMYASCPHRYFFSYILNIKTISRIEEELSNREKGSFIHNILYLFYKNHFPNIKDTQNISYEEIYPIIKQITHENISIQIDENKISPLIFGSETDRIISNISKYIVKDLSTMKDFIPVDLEIDFSTKSMESPLKILSNNGNPLIQVRGIIDRIDFSQSSNKIRVIDYKAGKNDFSYPVLIKELKDGYRFQPLLYSLKAQELHQKELDSWNYCFIQNSQKILSFQLNSSIHDNTNTTYNDISFNYLLKYIELIQQGNFPGHPRICHEYCEYKEICRVDLSKYNLKEDHVAFWKNITTDIEKPLE